MFVSFLVECYAMVYDGYIIVYFPVFIHTTYISKTVCSAVDAWSHVIDKNVNLSLKLKWREKHLHLPEPKSSVALCTKDIPYTYV